MNRLLACYAPIIGRILIGSFFLWNGIQAAFNLQNVATSISHAGLPWALGLAVITIIIEVGGGLLFVVGSYMQAAALCMALFLLLTSALLTNFNVDTQIAMFMQNMAIVGGLLYLAAKS